MRVSPRSLLGGMASRRSQDKACEATSPLRPGLWTLAAAVGIVIGASVPAAAQGFESDILKGTLQALGLVDEDPKPEIDYRERAPLVVPPGAGETLPAPADHSVTANPNWPKDPDVERRKREAAEANAPVIRDDPGRPLMPSELNKGRKKITAEYPTSDSISSGNKRDVLMPSQLGFTNWGSNPFGGSKEKPLTFEGEPERQSLVQPPPGYQTPAPNAPYGVVEPKKETFKFPTLFDRE